MSLMDQMHQKAMELGIPVDVHLDVTYRCNERCVHCYLDHDDHGEMSKAEIKELLQELADIGVFSVTFSGGEVFMRRDFVDLVEHARRLLFAVRIKTNGVMIRSTKSRSAFIPIAPKFTTPSPSCPGHGSAPSPLFDS
ncbi:MAG: hypothetical protein DMG71_20315 [Acidobacteria bacterium]|nr:MAG: hypothetical protein DMG71_20315 [Acidobacteriota bacterium]